MSSHHIVKDQQEPALIIDQWDPHYNTILGELLEWLPQIICFEDILEKIISLGIKVDTILVEEKNISYWKKIFSSQGPLEVISCQKSNFLDVAIARLVEKKHHAVNILTDDASLKSFILIAQAYPQLDIIVFAGKKKTIQHKEKVFRKWLSKGERLQVWNPNYGSLSTKGFRDDLSNKQIQQAELIVETSGVVTIESDVTPYMITEDI